MRQHEAGFSNSHCLGSALDLMRRSEHSTVCVCLPGRFRRCRRSRSDCRDHRCCCACCRNCLDHRLPRNVTVWAWLHVRLAGGHCGVCYAAHCDVRYDCHGRIQLYM